MACRQPVLWHKPFQGPSAFEVRAGRPGVIQKERLINENWPDYPVPVLLWSSESRDRMLIEALAHRLATAPRYPWPDRPIPVALVITDLDVGGAERALVALATGLDRSRWAPAVIALGSEGRLAAPLLTAGVPVTCLAADGHRPDRAVARLIGAMRRHRPCLVQSFMFHANVAARLAAPWAGGPWVVGGLRVAERRKTWHLTLDRLTTRLGTGSVCVSMGVYRFSRDVARLDPDRLVVIPNGIELSPFDRAEPLPREAIGVPEWAHMALFIGRLAEQKGLPILLDAAGRVAAARPEWHLVLVGDGPDRDRLRELAGSDPALTGRVHWLGPRDDVPALLKAADLLVLPSLWEGMPNVILEAMAARRAVVATAVEGTDELVLPGQTGWLVPPNDPRALAGALLDAASDPALLRHYGEAGRSRVESHFTLRNVVDAYDRLWAGILGLEPSRPLLLPEIQRVP
jgi:glycosyltransferase involved in cell wall biosynthesis